MGTKGYRVKIKDLPEDEHPLERLYTYEPQILKTSELVAILIRTRTSNATAVQVGEQFLQKYDDNLQRFANDNEVQIAEGIIGLEEVKAGQFMVAFELGRRMAAFLEEKSQISSPTDVARIMMPSMQDLQKELLYVLCLDTKNHVIKQRRIFEGSLNASIIHPREVFRFAIEPQHQLSLFIIILTGNPEPSEEDVRATKQLIEGGNLIQIPVPDRVIIGDGVSSV